MTRFSAHVQYDDWKGTAAADADASVPGDPQRDDSGDERTEHEPHRRGHQRADIIGG